MPNAATTISVAVPELVDQLEAAGPDARQPGPIPSSPASDGTRRWPNAAIALTAAAGVAVIAGAVFAIKFEIDNGRANDICRTDPMNCSGEQIAENTSLRQSAARDRAIAVAGFALGGVVAVSGAYVVWRTRRNTSATRHPEISIVDVSARGVMLATRVAW